MKSLLHSLNSFWRFIKYDLYISHAKHTHTHTYAKKKQQKSERPNTLLPCWWWWWWWWTFQCLSSLETFKEIHLCASIRGGHFTEHNCHPRALDSGLFARVYEIWLKPNSPLYWYAIPLADPCEFESVRALRYWNSLLCLHPPLLSLTLSR